MLGATPHINVEKYTGHAVKTRILTAEGQKLVSEGPPVNIPPPSASPYGPYGGGGRRCRGGVENTDLQTFDAESKFPMRVGWRGGGGGGGGG